MLRPYLRRRASGDTGDDRHRVARPHRRLALGELPDVPVVHVDVHKAAQPTVRGKEVRLQRCVLAGEPIEQLPTLPAPRSTAVRPPTNGRSGVGIRTVTAIRPSVPRW